MDWSIKNWRRRYILRHAMLPDEAWSTAVSGLSVLRGLSEEEMERLRELATLFLNEKQLVAAGGFSVDDDTRIKIAAQACLPILNLGLNYYAGWVSVIVYPGEFVPEHEFMDEAGVVHVVRDAMLGESWERGPVVLSGADAVRGGEHDGVNVVIHEFAHKLDILNGAMNGFPPLHREMSSEQWAQSFTAAYADFCAKVESGLEMALDPNAVHLTVRGELVEPPASQPEPFDMLRANGIFSKVNSIALDPYGAESPAEFFAVTSEAFFETPHVLQREYPDVYRQLAEFYRQDPAARRNAEAKNSGPQNPETQCA